MAAHSDIQYLSLRVGVILVCQGSANCVPMHSVQFDPQKWIAGGRISQDDRDVAPKATEASPATRF